MAIVNMLFDKCILIIGISIIIYTIIESISKYITRKRIEDIIFIKRLLIAIAVTTSIICLSLGTTYLFISMTKINNSYDSMIIINYIIAAMIIILITNECILIRFRKYRYGEFVRTLIGIFAFLLILGLSVYQLFS